MHLETYHVRLVVHLQDGTYKARWIELEGQESKSFPLNLPLDKEDKSDLRWYLEQYANFVGAGDRVRAAELEDRINAWGRSLFDALFDSAEGARVHTRLMDAARDGSPAILTLGTNESDVHVQPWEMLRDTRGPLVFQGVTIRRQLLGAGAARRQEDCLDAVETIDCGGIATPTPGSHPGLPYAALRAPEPYQFRGILTLMAGCGADEPLNPNPGTIKGGKHALG